MTLHEDLPRINEMVNVLTQVSISSLEYWLRRIELIRQEGELAAREGRDSVSQFIDRHRERLWWLLRHATPFPDAHARAVDLALLVDPVMQARGQYANWLPVLEGLAVHVDNQTPEVSIKLAELWRSVGRCYKLLGDTQRAAQALNIARGFTSGQGEAGMDLRARLLQEKAGVRALQMRFQEAQEIARQLLADAQAVGDVQTAALGHALLAFAYIQSYRPKACFEHAQQAYLLWWHLGVAEADQEQERRLAQTLHYMGEACRLTSHLSRARYYLQRACQRVHRLKDRHWFAQLGQSLGALALEEGDPDRAIEHIQQARSLFEELRDTRSVVNSTHALGVALFRAGRYREAEEFLRDALAGWQRVDGSLEVANVYYTLGKLYCAEGRMLEARQAYLSSRDVALSLQGEHRDRLLSSVEEELAKCTAA